MTEIPSIELENQKRKYSIVLKDLDGDGNHLCYDADIVLPNLQFGESHPFIIGIRGDTSKSFPIQDVWCIDQNSGVESDFQLAQEIIRQKHSQTHSNIDASFT